MKEVVEARSRIRNGSKKGKQEVEVESESVLLELRMYKEFKKSYVFSCH
jgi:hypothetical protein